jgi:hypothetical protein
MTLSFANINSLWGSLIVEELIRHGVDCFVISRGRDRRRLQPRQRGIRAPERLSL